jgi:hypothetical protein
MVRTLRTLLAAALLCSTAAAAPPAKEPPQKTSPAPGDDVTLPPGSADYSKMLAAVLRYKKGELTFAQLKQIVVAAKLPPHTQGCEYVISPVPMPPPGIPFNPAIMPKDWEHTFGEVAMTFWAGKITREEYDQLHEAAHKKLTGFPSCRGGAH